MRIVYGIQSTGKGHISRFLGLKPLFDRDGHELMVLASGYDEPPAYFREAVEGCLYYHYRGVSYVADELGGISKSATAWEFVKSVPELFNSIAHAQEHISAFGPQLIISDFEPITGSPLVSPGVTKVGFSHQNALDAPGVYHPPGHDVDRAITSAVARAFGAGLRHRLGCHFYPAAEECLPPIIRPAVRDAEVTNAGHVLVYHTLGGALDDVLAYANAHPDRRIVVYGHDRRDDTANVHFERDRAKFAGDLASADAYVGTAGFQSISEAYYLGKKIAVRPIEGQYEQTWNAAQLEHHGMGRWLRDSLDEALAQEFDAELHARLQPWMRDGTRTCYERIMALAEAS